MTTPGIQPAESPSPRFQYTLRTLLLLFVVLGSSMAVFGGWGIVVFVLAVVSAISIQVVRPLRWLVYLGLVVFIHLWAVCFYYWALTESNWPPNIAALLVWLASVGTLLVGAVRGRKKLSVLPSPPPAGSTSGPPVE